MSSAITFTKHNSIQSLIPYSIQSEMFCRSLKCVGGHNLPRSEKINTRTDSGMLLYGHKLILDIRHEFQLKLTYLAFLKKTLCMLPKR
ncbi:CLUMA_CG013348, isoform A [Clunio marinus]|uniref:CLUMA_CG013348, isoform A n=1 Tax=Clunio marinus TaxID=568069 RepID=A0A1J1ILW6_9DIPT|nr:CLUMA_CG013348, isoform A [Clunio marinus]